MFALPLQLLRISVFTLLLYDVIRKAESNDDASISIYGLNRVGNWRIWIS